MLENVPNKVKIGPFDFDIKNWTHFDGEVNQMYGRFSSVSFTIEIDFDRHPIKVVDTLLHEIMHGIYWAWGIHDGDGEERTVSNMSTGLTQVMRDNPHLLEWMQSTMKKYA